MPEFNFNFNFTRGGAPIVTLSGIGLSFNAGSRSMLGNPSEVDIGFDDSANVIAVRPHDPRSVAASYDFEPRISDGWIRLSMRDFMRYLSQKTGIDFLSKAIQFIPEKDEENGMLLIYVDESHMKNK